MEQGTPEFQLKIEGAGLLRISQLDGEVVGLEPILGKVHGDLAMRVAQAVDTIGEAFEREGNYAAAARAYFAACQLAIVAQDRLNTASLMIHLGLALKRGGNLEGALDVYGKALALLEQAEEDPAAEMRRTGVLGNLLLNTAALHVARRNSAEARSAATWCIELLEYFDDDASKSVAAQCRLVLEEVERMDRQAPPAVKVGIRRGPEGA